MDAGEGESSVKLTYGTWLVIIAELRFSLNFIMNMPHAAVSSVFMSVTHIQT